MKLISVVLAIIASIISFFLEFKAFSNKTMENFYVKWVYYFLLANILFWLFALIRTKTDSFLSIIKNYWKNHKIALILAFFLVSIGSIICKSDFRILADETNLLSMSEALYEERECKNYTSVFYYYYGFKNIIEAEVDKRPALFPLTVCFFHSLLGYRPENVFVVNIISAFFILLLWYHIVNFKFDKFWSNAAMLLLAAYPLFIIYYTSAGFEVFNLLFILILIVLFIKFLQNPTAVNTELLLLFLPLLGQTRYESASAVLCILPVIFIMLPKAEYFKFSYKLVIMPFFFIPLVWIRILTDNLKGLQADDKGYAFSWEYFCENLKNAWSFFTGQDLAYGVVPIITYLALVYFIWSFITKIYNFIINNDGSIEDIKPFFKTNKTKYLFIISITIFYIIHAAIRFAYWGGDFTMRSSSRLAIVFLPIFVFFAIKFCYSISLKFKIRRIYFLICFIALLFVYYPVAGQNLGVRDLTLYREFRVAREYLSNNFPNKNEYILIADRANLYVPFKYNSINFGRLNGSISFVKSNLNNRTYTYAIVIQMIDKETNTAIDSCKVKDSIKLTPLYETQIRADQFLRISKFTIKDM